MNLPEIIEQLQSANKALEHLAETDETIATPHASLIYAQTLKLDNVDQFLQGLSDKVENLEAEKEELQSALSRRDPANLYDEQKRELAEQLFSRLSLAQLEEIENYYLKP